MKKLGPILVLLLPFGSCAASEMYNSKVFTSKTTVKLKNGKSLGELNTKPLTTDQGHIATGQQTLILR